MAGRSRRLQTVGKLLRHKLGDLDRVIFDTDVMMNISEPFDVHHVMVDKSVVLRDLAIDQLFYVEALNRQTDGAATKEPVLLGR